MNTIQSRSYSDSGYRLMVLLKSHLREILKRESDNSEAIFLYDTGDHWVAFEQSAYQLSKLHPHSLVTPIALAIHPSPIVMASLSDRQLRMRAHFLTEPTKGLGKISAPRLSDTRYQTWRKRLIYNFKFQI